MNFLSWKGYLYLLALENRMFERMLPVELESLDSPALANRPVRVELTPAGKTSQMLRVADTETDPGWAAYRSVFAAEGIRALAFVPIVAFYTWSIARASGLPMREILPLRAYARPIHRSSRVTYGVGAGAGVSAGDVACSGDSGSCSPSPNSESENPSPAGAAATTGLRGLVSTGAGPIREILLGPVGYIAGLPLVGVAFKKDRSADRPAARIQ